ncbi:MAG: hypothetical protein EOP84_00765 [Verrucomicrobiaceae bacterium]|nr:MAG: hypothetical protein EOP84_00765 [Verrucomicrobiaceae bacterium]
MKRRATAIARVDARSSPRTGGLSIRAARQRQKWAARGSGLHDFQCFLQTWPIYSRPCISRVWRKPGHPSPFTRKVIMAIIPSLPEGTSQTQMNRTVSLFFASCVNDGYITPASTPAEASFGFVFSHCSIRTAKPGIRVYLGRPWRPDASTIFMNMEMPEGIRPEGWHNWGRTENEQTARFSEINSSGRGAAPYRRVKWARPLDPAKAAELTASRVLSGWAPE